MEHDDRSVNELVESTLQKTLGGKSVVSVRLDAKEIEFIDQLVFLGVKKNRSEATAMLIKAGIKANQHIFEKVQSYSEELQRIKDLITSSFHEEDESGFSGDEKKEG